MLLRSFRDVFQLLSPRQRLRALELFVLIALGAVLEMFSVALVLPILAVGAAPSIEALGPWTRRLSEALGDPDRATLVTILLSFLAGAYLIKTAFLVYSQWRQASFVFDLDLAVSTRLFDRYLRQPWDFHTQRNSASLVQNATSEITELRLAVTAQISLLAECLTLILLATLLAVASPLALLAIGSMVGAFGFCFQWLARDRVRRWGKVREQEHNARSKTLMEGLGSVKEIKLYGRERLFISRLAKAIQNLGWVSRRYLVVVALPRLTLEFVAVCALAITVSAMLWLGRPIEQVVPIIGMFAVAAVRILPSINRVITCLQQINFSQPAIVTLVRDCNLGLDSSACDGEANGRLSQSIEFDRVCYRYPETERLAVKNLSLSIKAGSTVAFIGSSGAGKSTVVDLMLGLLRPTSGSIRVDGLELSARPATWRNQVGYVPQTICLTDESLRANVAFGIPLEQIDDEAVAQAVRDAQMDQFIRSLPEGLDTIVGERGVRLSGGQRQRIGIARALYGNPSLLVLDEATSALDVDTEAQVMSAINSLHGSRTIVIVTHRMSTIAGADQVFRLANGELQDGSSA
jgi:ABC-type bacteriocin/lantibiotic exporter with double-glycine peptidase domain